MLRYISVYLNVIACVDFNQLCPQFSGFLNNVSEEFQLLRQKITVNLLLTLYNTWGTNAQLPAILSLH